MIFFLMQTKMPSGVFGTVWINCICELIIEILEFYFCYYFKRYNEYPMYGNFVYLGSLDVDFFVEVALINYGDDNLKYVSPIFREIYTHESIIAFSDFIKMGITPAKKSETLIEFKSVTHILFLKRTPVYNETIGRVLGQLELSSIAKMLAYTDSVDIRWEAMVLNQATRELSFHSVELFNKFKTIFKIEADQQATMLSVIETDEWSLQTSDEIPLLSFQGDFHIYEEEIAVPGLTKLTDSINMGAS